MERDIIYRAAQWNSDSQDRSKHLSVLAPADRGSNRIRESLNRPEYLDPMHIILWRV